MKKLAFILCLILSIPALSSADYWPTTHPTDAVQASSYGSIFYIWRESGEVWIKIVPPSNDYFSTCGFTIVSNGEQYTDIQLAGINDDDGHYGPCHYVYVTKIFKLVSGTSGDPLPFDISAEFILIIGNEWVTIPSGPDYIPPDNPDPCDLCDQCPVCETCEVCQECEECQECPNTDTVYNQGYQAGLAALEAAKKDAYDKGYKAGLAAAQCDGACTNEELLDAQQHGYAQGYSDGANGVGFNNPGYILPCIDVVSGLDIPITCLKYKDVCFSFTLEYNLKKSAWLIGPDIQVLP